tara:strand:+ start:1660 stop:1950 length:291 start_codon:yes stop_codon:yes gene_type:complete
MTSALQNLLIIVGILLIAGIGYYLFKQNQEEGLQNAQVDNQAAVRSAESLRRLNELQNITLDTTLFSDPRFTSFTSFTNEVAPEPYGKANPFIESD